VNTGNCVERKSHRRQQDRRTTMNEEGYRDPTADRAIRSYNRLPHGKKEDLSALCIVARRLGFEVTGVRDKKTGREVILDAGRKTDIGKEIRDKQT
jgi:hypothetical protein